MEQDVKWDNSDYWEYFSCTINEEIDIIYHYHEK